MKYFLSLILFLSGINMNCQNCVFEEETYNFGNINVKDKYITHQFKLKNDSNTPLIFKSATARCSCIETLYPKHPIAPNDTSSIYVRYYINSTGVFNKKVKLSTNGKNCYITIKGNCFREKKHKH